jgi:hypothetical protein
MKIRIKDLNLNTDFFIYKIEGSAKLIFYNPTLPQNADCHSISWVKKNENLKEKIRSTKSSFVVTSDGQIDLPLSEKPERISW